MSKVFTLDRGKRQIGGTGVWFPRIIENMAGKHHKSYFIYPSSQIIIMYTILNKVSLTCLSETFNSTGFLSHLFPLVYCLTY